MRERKTKLLAFICVKACAPLIYLALMAFIPQPTAHDCARMRWKMGGGVTRSFSRVLFIRHFFGSRGGFCTNLPNSRGWEFSVNDNFLFAFVSRPLLVHHDY